MLAHFVSQRKTIAVGGTSGKSTVAAMVFEILTAAAKSPSLITGGKLVQLIEQGYIGNAWTGKSDILVIEADESDGTIVKYGPETGVVLNLSKDHKEEAVCAEMFAKFRENTRTNFITGEDNNLEFLQENSFIFGFGETADIKAEHIELHPAHSTFTIEKVNFKIPMPGIHNVQNAAAAIAVCLKAGVSLAEMTKPLAEYHGVHRRFQSLGKAAGVEVIDDFAHNPAKIAATIKAAQIRGSRVIAVFQPHGFYPTRFMWDEFVESFAEVLRPQDILWMQEIYYAGGTTQKDFSASDLVKDIAEKCSNVYFSPDRKYLLDRLSKETKAGDIILVMGARDETLSDFARDILSILKK